MRKLTALFLAVVLTALPAAGCGSSAQNEKPADSGQSPAAGADTEAATGWEPTGNITWYVTSSPGGGSDIFTRKITDIMTTGGLVSKTFLVTNKTDGGGEVGRLEVANTAKSAANTTLLTFNSGDLMPMVENTGNRVENFTPIAIMAVDKQLIFKGEKAVYDTFEEAVEAAKAGTTVVIGGSKGDDIATYEKLIAEIGLTEEQMPYITYDSTGEAITAILGGHVDLVIAKPASSSEYVKAGRLMPVLALSTERFSGDFADAPTLSEAGDYNDVEVPVWRGVVGPKAMSEEAAAFWSAVLKQVSESEAWKTEYLETNMLISNYMDAAAAAAYMQQYQEEYLATLDQ